MSQSAIECRLETLDEMRELALELSQAERLGPVRSKKAAAEEPSSFEVQTHFKNHPAEKTNVDLSEDGSERG